jgi:hypothetical protein
MSVTELVDVVMVHGVVLVASPWVEVKPRTEAPTATVIEDVIVVVPLHQTILPATISPMAVFTSASAPPMVPVQTLVADPIE